MKFAYRFLDTGQSVALYIEGTEFTTNVGWSAPAVRIIVPFEGAEMREAYMDTLVADLNSLVTRYLRDVRT
jgi:hypothetical protein